jgi:spermidine synthase
MTLWTLLDSTQVPGNGGELRLYQRNNEFSIKIVGRGELMNSRVHDSENALAEHTCARLVDCAKPQLLIGGLGMGFTLAAALQHLSEPESKLMTPSCLMWITALRDSLARRTIGSIALAG